MRDAQIGEIVKSIEQHLQRASATHWGLVRNVVWTGIQQRRPRVTPLPPTISQLSRTASENAAADGTYSDEPSLEKLEGRKSRTHTINKERTTHNMQFIVYKMLPGA